MTSNQISYAKLQEDRRHNLTSEVETARHNRRSEDVGYYTGGAAYAGVAENRRHNQEQEAINWYTAENLGDLQAAQTAKTASEVGVEAGKLGETTRHNVQTERVESGKLGESRRHNIQTEKVESGKLEESKRHNTVTEAQGQQNADTNTRNSYVNMVGTAAEAAKDISTAAKNFSGISGLYGKAAQNK